MGPASVAYRSCLRWSGGGIRGSGCGEGGMVVAPRIESGVTKGQILEVGCVSNCFFGLVWVSQGF